MDVLMLKGGASLKGDVNISGSKNSSLPIMAATLLTDDTVVLKRVPNLRDTRTMIKLLQSLGKEVDYKDNTLTVKAGKKAGYIADYDLVSTMRGSFCVLGPLLGKLKKAKVSLPGGCVIGIRPVDLHIKGVEALGAKISVDGGYVLATAPKLIGNEIFLGGVFGSSVLATANVLMAAVLAEGETVIEFAACEPEIEDLTEFLIEMGANIEGKGSPRLKIKGVKKLKGITYEIIPDRIEAGTYILLAAATRSDLTIKNANLKHLFALVDRLNQAGVKVYAEKNGDIKVSTSKKFKPVSVTTYPYPGFPTDLQAQFMAFMATIEGVSIISDKVYPDRFIHIAEMNRMGADIRREGTAAIVQGVKKLHGAPVMASDLRASAALLIAGLMAKGTTEIHRIYHLERGYEDLEDKLLKVGAKVWREKEK
ncbi:MAG: UDP-N-acetylglucosamine 1-carboxyvinyltransferase [Candidatus Omnitrophica bacterium]|nr:UDP-N-acetylglucosamine 1-carboxyvinyltransferase [Candidatus Omnitrophota bacterium]